MAQQADEWGGGAGSTSQQQREREEEGEEGQQAGGQREQQQADQAAGFWHTLRGMLGDIYLVARGPEGKALQMALWLAFFNQAFASTSIINHAPQVGARLLPPPLLACPPACLPACCQRAAACSASCRLLWRPRRPTGCFMIPGWFDGPPCRFWSVLGWKAIQPQRCSRRQWEAARWLNHLAGCTQLLTGCHLFC